jgi:hypothetical protein
MSGLALAGENTSEKDADEGQEKEATNSGTNKVVVMSPGKVTHKATTSSGIPQEALHGQRNLVQDLIQQ